MYYICYSSVMGDFFETVDGEDAMQMRVDELCKALGCDPDEIHVFDAETEIGSTGMKPSAINKDVANHYRVDFTVCTADSDGKPVRGTERSVTVLYNRRIISDNEVEKLITAGNYEYDHRVIVTSPEAADAFCRGIMPDTTGR